MLTPENQSSNLHQTHRENRMSNASSVLKILADKGGYYSPLQWRSGLGMLVCPSVRPWTLDPENRCKDFDKTWYEVKG